MEGLLVRQSNQLSMLERFKRNEWVILRVDKNSSRRHL
jgi:hypothetical protein